MLDLFHYTIAFFSFSVFFISGSLFTCGNILYILLFGWWISLVYLLVGIMMYIIIIGAPHGNNLYNNVITRCTFFFVLPVACFFFF